LSFPVGILKVILKFGCDLVGQPIDKPYYLMYTTNKQAISNIAAPLIVLDCKTYERTVLTTPLDVPLSPFLPERSSPVMVPLSSHGEIADFQDVDQFQPGRSEFECGFFAVAIVKAMNQVGRPPTQSVSAMIAEAETWYAQFNGNNSASNEAGMSLQQLYALLPHVGLHYQGIALDIDLIRAWICIGYPVIIAGAEIGMYDLELGDIVPYPWHPTGNHMLVITGVTSDGNFLVRDPANCTDLNDPHSLRPGPRRYAAIKLQLFSATVAVPSWLPRPPAGFDPRKESASGNIPAGWRDNGTTLTAPNGHIVVRGFREYILAHTWNEHNLPLEEEVSLNSLEESNPSLGGGSQQVFNWTTLEWTTSRGVFVAWTGQELLKVRAERDILKTHLVSLKSQLQALLADL
jgi:hypothetical protein